MRIHLIVLLFILVLIIPFRIIIAQTPIIQWQKCLGGDSADIANSIQQTTDDGYIVAGYTRSFDGDVTDNHGLSDYWIVKLDSTGNMIWEKSLGGSKYELANSIQQTNDNGYIVAGYTTSLDGDVTDNHGLADYWIVKLDTAGNTLWQKCFGGSSDDVAASIFLANDNGFIIAGSSLSTDGDVSGHDGGSDFWIIKTDSIGNIQWQKCFGGSNDDWAVSVQQTQDEGYIVAGYSTSNDGYVTGNHGGTDYWILKISSSGDFQWQKCFGGSGNDFLTSCIETKDNGYILSGWTNSDNGDVTGHYVLEDYWIVKIDSQGNIQWEKCFGGLSSDVATSIQLTIDNGYIISGKTDSEDFDVTSNYGCGDYWIVKLDSTGTLQWQKNYGGSGYDYPTSIRETIDGGYVVAGHSNSNNYDVSGNHGQADYWIIKLNSVSYINDQYHILYNSVFPNPATNELTIDFTQSGKYLFDLFDLLGAKRLSTRLDSNSKTVDLTSVDSGVYVFTIVDDNGDIIKTDKLIIIK